MRISLYLNKSIEENASIYFDKAKKAKKKHEGALKALKESEDALERINKKIQIEEKETEEKAAITHRKKEWYEKFRWFNSSDKILVIAGKDATTNEIIIKKYTEDSDLVFHTDISGSPFGVIKAEGGAIPEKTINEAAQFVACYSKGWQQGVSRLDVFSIKPEQVSKTPPPGEYIQKGSFMIYGKKEYIPVDLVLFIGIMDDGRIMPGPEPAVSAHCKKYVKIIPGKEKTSDIAKKIRSQIGGDLDEIIRAIPGGGAKIA